MKDVRRATPEDAEALAMLRFEFRSSVEPATESRAEFLARCVVWMRSRLRDDGPWHCWVAEGAAGILGHAWLELVEKVPNPVGERERHAYSPTSTCGRHIGVKVGAMPSCVPRSSGLAPKEWTACSSGRRRGAA